MKNNSIPGIAALVSAVLYLLFPWQTETRFEVLILLVTLWSVVFLPLAVKTGWLESLEK